MIFRELNRRTSKGFMQRGQQPPSLWAHTRPGVLNTRLGRRLPDLDLLIRTSTV